MSVKAAAYVDADKEGGHELTGVAFSQPAMAVCDAVDRVGVIPQTVDTSRVEAWTNASEQPVVFPFREDVQGDIEALPICSMADSENELSTDVLHGDHVHSGH